MFTLKNDILLYNGIEVHHEGETFKNGNFNAYIIEGYCFVASTCVPIDTVIDDFIECNYYGTEFSVKIQSLTF